MGGGSVTPYNFFPAVEASTSQTSNNKGIGGVRCSNFGNPFKFLMTNTIKTLFPFHGVDS